MDSETSKIHKILHLMVLPNVLKIKEEALLTLKKLSIHVEIFFHIIRSPPL